MGNKSWGDPTVTRGEKREAKRRAVLEAGARLFNDQGYEQTSLDDIARALNITKRTIYYYVQSKEEILYGCQQLGMEFLSGTLERCYDQSLPVTDRIRLLVTGYCAWVCTDLGACAPLVREVSLSGDRRAELREGRARLDHLLRDMIGEGIKAGEIRACDPQLTSAAVFGALNWVPYWNRRTNPRPPVEIAESFLALITHGLMPNSCEEFGPVSDAETGGGAGGSGRT
jgi:AcrR family transcriptional regulator